MAKKTITKDTEYPRSWETTTIDENGEEMVLYIVTQPYLSGLYMAISGKGLRPQQNVIPYSKLKKIFTEISRDKNAKNLHKGKIGDFLSEEKINLLN